MVATGRILADGRDAGGGFVVAPRAVVTAGHVVRGRKAASLAFALPSGEALSVDSFETDETLDVAVLRLGEDAPDRLPTGSPVEEDRWVVEARPLGNDPRLTGTVTARRRSFTNARGHETEGIQLLVDQALGDYRGYSGSPVTSLEWVAIGVLVEQVRSRATALPGEAKLASNVLYAVALDDVLARFDLVGEVAPAVECPYRGLDPFEVEHTELYFGRKAAVDELLSMLVEQPFVSLVGASGSGKSSLVRAGLAQGLERWPVPDLSSDAICMLRPDEEPVRALAAVLASSFRGDVDMLVDTLKEGRPAAERVEQLARVADLDGALIIVDQFERLYTQCPGREERRDFCDLLVAASERAKVLIVLRADFYALALAHPGLARSLKNAQLTLLPMNDEELREAIVEPARRLHRTFELGLVDTLVADVRGRAGDLPLLEFALTELWHRDAHRGLLTRRTYDGLGYATPTHSFPGVQGAIASRAERVWRILGAEEQAAARRVFLGLVAAGPHTSEGGQLAFDTSRRAWRAEWDETTRRAADRLIEARLLTGGRASAGGQPTVEVAHEALIRAWPRLQHWLDADRLFVQWRDQELAPYLQRWIERDRDVNFLLPEPLMEQARRWLASHASELAGPPAEYIAASEDRLFLDWRDHFRTWAREWIETSPDDPADRAPNLLVDGRELAAARGWAQLRSADLTANDLAYLDASEEWQAHEEQRWRRLYEDAERNREVALARQLAAQAELARSQRSHLLERSALLAIESLRRSPSPEAYRVLWRAIDVLMRPVPSGTLAFSHDGRCVEVPEPVRSAWARIAVPGTPALSAHFGARGVRLLGIADTTAWIWDARTGAEVARIEHPTPIQAHALSCRLDRLALASADGDIRVTSLKDGHAVRLNYDGPVRVMTFSGDGHGLAVAPGSSTMHGHGVRVFSIEEREPPLVVSDGEPNTAVFGPGPWHLITATLGVQRSPQGAIVNAWKRDGHSLARLWSIAWDEMIFSLTLVGSQLGLATRDGVALVLDARTGEPVARISHDDAVTAIALSHKGRHFVTGAGNGTVRVWDSSGQELGRGVLDGSVIDVAFDEEERLVVGKSHDGRTRTWAAPGRVSAILSHPRRMRATGLLFSDGGDYLGAQAVRAGDREVRRASFDPRHERLVIVPDPAYVLTSGHESVGFWRVRGDVNARRFAVAATFTELHGGLFWASRVRRPRRAAVVARFRDEGQSDGELALSPDGQFVATADGKFLRADKSTHEARCAARLWSVDRRDPVACVRHAAEVSAVAFSPDGRLLATADLDGEARVWDIPTARPCGGFRLHGKPYGLRFAPGGRRLLALMNVDGAWAVSLWDLATSREQGRFEHENRVQDVALTPDNRYLATISQWMRTFPGVAESAVVRIWDTNTGGVFVEVSLDTPAQSLEFSTDGRFLAVTFLAVTDDAEMYVWGWRPEHMAQYACRHLTRNLTAAEWRQYLDDEPYSETCRPQML